jgi:hypothetical protein
LPFWGKGIGSSHDDAATAYAIAFALAVATADAVAVASAYAIALANVSANAAVPPVILPRWRAASLVLG